MATYELPLLEVSGSARELGEQQGEAFRDRIQQFVEMRFAAVQKYFADRDRADQWDRINQAGVQSFGIFEAWDPEGYAEHNGIAAGARVDPTRLFTVANMTDMRDAVLLSASSGPPLSGPSEGGLSAADAEGCSAVVVPASGTKAGVPLAGQTWDLNPTDVDYVVAIRRKPTNGPQTWAVTCTGCLSLMGLNEHGLAVGTTNIKTYGSGPGVGYLSILHRSIRAKDCLDAEVVIREAPHAGAHTYWLADAERQVELESSPNGSFARVVDETPIVRTNHCLFETHQDLQGELPGDSSKARVARLKTLLASKQSHESLKALFADRADGVLSVNRYPEDEQGTATNAVFIVAPAERRAWACRGNADRGTWVTLDFD